MKLIRVLLGALCVLALPAGVSAQKLATGQWTGTASDPNGQSTAITVDISYAGDTAKAVMKIAELPVDLVWQNLKLAAGKLTFSIAVGNNSLNCSLNAGEAGAYSGACTDDGGGSGAISISPPKAGAAAPDATVKPAAATTASASGAKLDAGKWTGTVTPASMGEMALEFDVVNDGAAQKASFNIASAGMAFPVTDIKLEGAKLTFSFVVDGMGAIKCELNRRDDKAYAGNCADPEGGPAPIVIIPPKK